MSTIVQNGKKFKITFTDAFDGKTKEVIRFFMNKNSAEHWAKNARPEWHWEYIVEEVEDMDEYKFYVNGECCGSNNVSPEDTDYDYYMDASFIARETKQRVDVYKNGIFLETV